MVAVVAKGAQGADGAETLDERSMARLAQGRRIYAGLATEHERVFAEVLADRRMFDGSAYNRAARQWNLGALVRDLTAEQSRCLFFAAAEQLAATGDMEFYALPVMCYDWFAVGPGGPDRRMGGTLSDLGALIGLDAEPFADLGPDLPPQMQSVLNAVFGGLSSGFGAGVRDGEREVIDRLTLTADDVRLLAAVSEPADGLSAARPIYLVVSLVEEMLTRRVPGAADLAEAVAAQVSRWHLTTYHNLPVRERGFSSNIADLRDHALSLAGYPPPPHDEGPIGREDGWGLAAIERLGPVEDWPSGTVAVLEHCVQPKATRPSARWQKVCRQRLAGVADADGLVRGLLDLVLTTGPVTFRDDHTRTALLVRYNEPLVRGLIWAAAVLDPDWLPSMLRSIAARCLRLSAGSRMHETAVPGEKLPNACVVALALSGSQDSLIALARIGRATTNRAVHKVLESSLEEVAERRGTSAAALMDRLLPDHGLPASGVLELADGWSIRLDDGEGAVLAGPDGARGAGAAGGAPTGADEALADLKATVALARSQQEAMFATRRELHVDDFIESYLSHPVRGWLATRLAWTYFTTESDAGGAGAALHGFPDPSGESVHTTGGVVAVPDGCLVRLVHPVALPAAELDRLRALATKLGISQPVRQLWRETYLPSAAERAAGLRSDRYAGHVLRTRGCYGLARGRGWGGGFLYSGFDGGQDAVAKKDYPSAGLRAAWSITQADDADTDIELCLSKEVGFFALGDVQPVPVPLADVPPEVFSEAMRDLDLIVAATTVANDPLWLDEYRGVPLLDAYWERLADGGLDQLRVHRREILRSAYWMTGPRFALTDTELVVRGALASYRIDLATANVRMEPSGRWLSFDSRVTRAPAQACRLAIAGVPTLDDDEILQRILVRAAILADDEVLASRKLLKQIRG